jgi:ATP-binding protein involved in chromosome partitioning
VAIIAVTGRKGGIGKSTITANLAAELAALGQTVAVLDTDVPPPRPRHAC